MRNTSAENNLKNIFNKFNFKTLQISVVKDVVLVRFENSEMITAEMMMVFISKSGFVDVEIERVNKKDWSMLSFIIPEAA
jgi:hypothetical protein